MAIGKASDFVIYQEQFYGGMYESVVQNTTLFNGASQNAIRMVAAELKGDYNKESFLKYISGIITRRDTTSVAGVTDLAMSMDEKIGVKVNRKVGPVAQTLDAWRKAGLSSEEMSFKLGQMIGEQKMLDYVNTQIKALSWALQGQAGVVHDGSAGTITHTALVNALAKFGDKAGSILCWVMHSKVYFDLVKQAIADKVYEIAGVTIYAGTVATLGRPTVVIDAADLFDATPAPDVYWTLGLVSDAALLVESEEQEIVAQVVTGLENLVLRIQGEYAFNLNLKGFKWDTTNGGVNPADAAIGTSSNWDKVAYSDKLLPGVALKTQ